MDLWNDKTWERMCFGREVRKGYHMFGKRLLQILLFALRFNALRKSQGDEESAAYLNLKTVFRQGNTIWPNWLNWYNAGLNWMISTLVQDISCYNEMSVPANLIKKVKINFFLTDCVTQTVDLMRSWFQNCLPDHCRGVDGRFSCFGLELYCIVSSW